MEIVCPECQDYTEDEEIELVICNSCRAELEGIGQELQWESEREER